MAGPVRRVLVHQVLGEHALHHVPVLRALANCLTQHIGAGLGHHLDLLAGRAACGPRHGVVELHHGAPAAALRLALFPIFFLIFTVPLPGPLVAAVTGPLKAGVSFVASELLFALGYPVSRAGVILTVGPYLILVADACAGLTSMFSLEAVGLLYLNVVKHPSAARNALLAALVIPIAFIANVIRVLVLVLVTYHLGDAAGRGFLHGFAGMLLFVLALILIFATDQLIGLCMGRRGRS